MTSTQCRPGQDRELKVHDGIVGSFILASLLAGIFVSTPWLWVAGVISVLMISSAFTGFCPVHFALSKIMPAA